MDEELAAAIKAFQAAEDGAGDFADSAQDATDQISDLPMLPMMLPAM